MAKNNGDNFEGEYVNGLRQGQGTITFSNGAAYIGKVKDDIRHG